ncbi:PriCT-2 domain-containing protein [Falsiroseomonas sp. HW251]|uniref:PriCT-2 domain-containing protein n=1 Tax=Falsiroseomonas sp. HW251 TaxID=3390998 RepID=UPI003D319D60
MPARRRPGLRGRPPPGRGLKRDHARRQLPGRCDGTAVAPDAAGEDLFLAWSAQSPKNDPAASWAKWLSFGTSPLGTSAGTLFWEARQHGWAPKRARAGRRAVA